MSGPIRNPGWRRASGHVVPEVKSSAAASYPAMLRRDPSTAHRKKMSDILWYILY
jgi:hypothetical protein